MGELNVRSKHACFGGTIGFYRHESVCCRSVMNFSVYVPPQAIGQAGKKVPVLYFLSGLTCSDENFMAKSGAIAVAADSYPAPLASVPTPPPQRSPPISP